MRPQPEPILDDLRDERLVVALITAGLVTAGALVQAGFLGPRSTANPALHLLQGPVVAIYGLVLSVCIDPKRGLVPGTLFVLAGASQPGWLLGTLVGLSALGLHRSTIPDPLWQALPFALTGLVFTPIAWLAVRAWWGLAFMLLTTAAAAYVTGWRGGAVWGVPAEAVAVTLLHLGLCWTLTGAVVARTWRIVPDHRQHCPACGYPREGLRASICPECGGRLP